MIQFAEDAMELMKTDALSSFPHECCGFIFGCEEEDTRNITVIQEVINISEQDQRRRFSISSADYLHAEKFALENNLSLLGIYHSHPNHPAIPSERDRQAAQPFFSYIIISVSDNHVTGIRSWRINAQEQFEEEQINELVISIAKTKQ